MPQVDEPGRRPGRVGRDGARALDGPGAPAVRMLPKVLDVADSCPPPDGDLRVAFGLDDQRPATGLARLLRHAASDGLRRQPVRQDQPHAAVRPRHHHTGSPPRRRVSSVSTHAGGSQSWVPAAHQVGYAMSGEQLRDLLARGVPVLKERVPGADITPDRLRP